jgi:hypothetical protein
LPDDPDGGELARLSRPNLPPHIGSIALHEPQELMMATV